MYLVNIQFLYMLVLLFKDIGLSVQNNCKNVMG